MTLVHATCVAIDGAGVLIRGPSGSGKSDLGLRLIDDGARLVADDYCEVTADAGMLTARAPATIAGRIEVRGYGLARLPVIESAVIALVVDLKPARDIPRLPETVTCTIDAVTLPWIMVDPAQPSAAAKVRLAARGVERIS
jgi:serine kinase of HPr protein (carbohydrate metabolism regulator)